MSNTKGGSKRARGIKPPYLPKINGYPLNPFFIFGTNNEEEKRRKMKTRDEPPFHLAAGFATVQHHHMKRTRAGRIRVWSMWTLYLPSVMLSVTKSNKARNAR